MRCSYFGTMLTRIFSAIAISAIIQFFAVQFKEVDIVWWGNNIPYEGCDGTACSLFTLGPNETHFGPGVGQFK